ncbi:NFACT family protein [Rubrivirga sp. S365]|uniref:NFACT family protein n=1 Tax=Rubrivirga litoralis TaxID=3075598 RepID=A0ABU3BM77_9BACT|nr:MULTISPECIES: NFACT RNA binding domain-containing protein [unclassified Rubrivirga]MDT0630404.1 NFACT family protein [Rubrivirga sp. F394]MDT7855915.1 NFACT family protein [Rubrivirga sp. S365]
MDYFTLRALAHEWDAALAGWRLDAAWTQSPNELSLGLERGGDRRTVRVVCDPALPLLFQTEGGGRQRRNTADVFPDLDGAVVAGVRTAHLDRHVVFETEGGAALQVLLFGSRPTVLWIENGRVRDAFLHATDWEGEEAQAPRAAPDPTTPEAVRARWRADRKTVEQAARRAAPLLPPALAADAARRAGLDPSAPPADLADGEVERLAEALAAVRAEVEPPRPTVLWRGDLAEALLPAPPAHVGAGWRAEPFETADAAARVYAKRALGQRRFQALYRPVAAALERAHGRRARSADAMLEELSQPSRADRYETWGHLLMAQAAGDGPGREAATLPDIVGGAGEPVEIPLDPALSAVENAERYYDKARRTRRARDEAESRWADVQAEADASGDLLDRLRALDRVPDLEAFLSSEAAALAPFAGRGGTQGGGGEPAEPFRRVPLPGGFEALVGKHARGNAHLTTRVASPHDLWLHARGVPGSHVVVRRAGRSTEVPPATIRAAARLAAWFSTAKTQTVVPVTVTERKYVRPVKGGPPGLVRVDREDVLDVTPARP